MPSIITEPYRFFFPLGVLSLIWGALVWIPLLWNPSEYPVLAHRYLMLNGFAGCFIAGFLMTAVPKFSRTFTARKHEIYFYFFVTLVGIIPAYMDLPNLVFGISSLQPLIILYFLFSRILKRKENPPYSFVFIFVGLILWFLSGILSIFLDNEVFKNLHYEGAIAAIILGVGSRLIPGILGHVEIVQKQRALYEKVVPLLKTVPLHFVLLMMTFIVSYFIADFGGSILRGVVVFIISFKYWKLYKSPTDKTALTWCIWTAAWLILLSFTLNLALFDGGIHISHSFFINGIVLLSLLIATRVLQSHGPKNKMLENSKVLYLVTFLVILAASTRVSAYYMPEHYLRHLGYSSFILVLAVLIWSGKYLRFVRT